jgi:murein DD-endopeptidase MepM/ murein hydrolase activator NlpD
MSRRTTRSPWSVAALAAKIAAASLAVGLVGAPEAVAARAAASDSVPWAWPVPGGRTVLRAFEAPPTRYAAGHRGIDLSAAPGTEVRSPVDGTLHFVGVVVDRPVVTVETSSGILVSVEPVASSLHDGDPVSRAARIGTVASGGHCSGSCLHLGVRVNGEYVSPLRFFGGVPRAVLLPMR